MKVYGVSYKFASECGTGFATVVANDIMECIHELCKTLKTSAFGRDELKDYENGNNNFHELDRASYYIGRTSLDNHIYANENESIELCISEVDDKTVNATLVDSYFE